MIATITIYYTNCTYVSVSVECNANGTCAAALVYEQFRERILLGWIAAEVLQTGIPIE